MRIRPEPGTYRLTFPENVTFEIEVTEDGAIFSVVPFTWYWEWQDGENGPFLAPDPNHLMTGGYIGFYPYGEAAIIQGGQEAAGTYDQA